MPTVIGVKFSTSPKVYYYGAGSLDPKKGDKVIAPSVKGDEIATVVLPKFEREQVPGELKDIIRIANNDDLRGAGDQAAKANEIRPIIKELVGQKIPEMHISKVEVTPDCTKCIISFTSEGRVDFRDLVKEIASRVKMRIELKQIGTRDECRLLGGLAPCGRVCCCSGHQTEYPHTSIKMAKNQNLSLNPAKVSGLCGRLMCCLSYENEHYVETNKRCPKVGGKCKTKCGQEGTLASINQLKETVKVKVFQSQGDGYDIKEFSIDELDYTPLQNEGGNHPNNNQSKPQEGNGKKKKKNKNKNGGNGHGNNV